jgi:dephospho-CoA kinase
MPFNSSKPLIAVIGGICSGKSAAAREFEKLGCGRVDADKIVHNLLDKDDIKQEIVDEFGDSVIGGNGRINRSKLARKAFSGTGSIKKLNNILHPEVLRRSEQLIADYNKNPEIKAVVLDIPLLVEAGWDKWCDKVVFVHCDLQKRLERASETGEMEPEQLKIREKFQISLDKKAKLSDNTINNNSDLSILAEQVAKIFSQIVCENPEGR